MESSEIGPKDMYPTSLITKLVKAVDACRYVQKQGWNKMQGWSYVREEDVMNIVRKSLTDNRLAVLASQVDMFTEDIPMVAKSGKEYTSRQTTVTMEFVIVDADTGESLPPRRFYGTSATPGDKQIYVATTNCQKYFMLKTFMIATGDDDAEAAPDPVEPSGQQTVANSRVRQEEPAKGNESQPSNQQQHVKSNGITQSQEDGLRVILGAIGVDPQLVVKYLNDKYGVSHLRELTHEQASNLMEDCQEDGFAASLKGGDGNVADTATAFDPDKIETVSDLNQFVEGSPPVKEVVSVYMKLREKFGPDHEVTKAAQAAIRTASERHSGSESSSSTEL